MLVLVTVTALLGAVTVARIFHRAGIPAWMGLPLGALCGIAGPYAALTPLDQCMFEDGRTNVDKGLGVLLGAGASALLIVIVRAIVERLTRSSDRPGRVDVFDKGSFRGRWLFPWIALSPTLIILVLFLYRPMLSTVRMSTLIVRTGAPRQPFVCLDNYSKLTEPTVEWWAVAPTVILIGALAWRFAMNRRMAVSGRSYVYQLRMHRIQRLVEVAVVVAVVAWAAALFGPNYRTVFTTTLILTTGTVALSIAGGLFLAVLLSQRIRGRSIYRTLLIWPYAISPPIAGILFSVMFNPLFGVIGEIWQNVTGNEMGNYANNPWTARGVVVLASVWKTLGFSIVFYVSGLQNVPTDTLEAAQLDGAGRWNRFRYVTLPALAPITFFLIVTNVTYAFFEVYGTISFLTKGGPSETTEDAMFTLIDAAKVRGDFGAGSAQSILLFVMVLGVTAWQFASTGRRVEYQR